MNYKKMINTLTIISIVLELIQVIILSSELENVHESLVFVITLLFYIPIISVAYYGIYHFKNYGRILFALPIIISEILGLLSGDSTDTTSAVTVFFDDFELIFSGALMAMCWLPNEAKLAFKKREVNLSKLEKETLSNLENGRERQDIFNNLIQNGNSADYVNRTLDNAATELNRLKNINSAKTKVLWGVISLIIFFIILFMAYQADILHIHKIHESSKATKFSAFVLWLYLIGGYKIYQGLKIYEENNPPVTNPENTFL